MVQQKSFIKSNEGNAIAGIKDATLKIRSLCDLIDKANSDWAITTEKANEMFWLYRDIITTSRETRDLLVRVMGSFAFIKINEGQRS
jgi:hypothetical protein